jgi:hypothetical protein
VTTADAELLYALRALQVQVGRKVFGAQAPYAANCH